MNSCILSPKEKRKTVTGKKVYYSQFQIRRPYYAEDKEIKFLYSFYYRKNKALHPER